MHRVPKHDADQFLKVTVYTDLYCIKNNTLASKLVLRRIAWTVFVCRPRTLRAHLAQQVYISHFYVYLLVLRIIDLQVSAIHFFELLRSHGTFVFHNIPTNGKRCQRDGDSAYRRLTARPVLILTANINFLFIEICCKGW